MARNDRPCTPATAEPGLPDDSLGQVLTHLRPIRWGGMWGFGGLTFGLTMRYLGLSLGMAVALGLTTIIGTMGPPIFHGALLELASKLSGQVTFLGILVALVGIVVVANAGRAKDRELAGE
jgi:L-rhamnose-H+ transport protein